MTSRDFDNYEKLFLDEYGETYTIFSDDAFNIDPYKLRALQLKRNLIVSIESGNWDEIQEIITQNPSIIQSPLDLQQRTLEQVIFEPMFKYVRDGKGGIKQITRDLETFENIESLQDKYSNFTFNKLL